MSWPGKCGFNMNELFKETMSGIYSFSRSSCPGLQERLGPSGIHLFNRVTGINMLIDEIKPPPHLWSKAPRQVSIALTNACDLNCPHCYAPKKPASLDLEDLMNWIVELDTNGCVGVGLGGGEPTLYPKLLELCSLVSNNTSVALIMTTHGHNLNDQLLDALANHINFIRISMDGVGSTYETIRGRSFDALLNRINALRKRTFFGINYLVNSKTMSDINDAVQIAADLGASEFLLIPEVPVGLGKEVDRNTKEQLEGWVKNYRGPIPLSISERSAEGLPYCNPFEKERGLMSFAHIDASGVLKITSYRSGGVKILGDGVMPALDGLKNLPEEETQ